MKNFEKVVTAQAKVSAEILNQSRLDERQYIRQKLIFNLLDSLTAEELSELFQINETLEPDDLGPIVTFEAKLHPLFSDPSYEKLRDFINTNRTKNIFIFTAEAGDENGVKLMLHFKELAEAFIPSKINFNKTENGIEGTTQD